MGVLWQRVIPWPFPLFVSETFFFHFFHYAFVRHTKVLTQELADLNVGTEHTAMLHSQHFHKSFFGKHFEVH